MSEDKQFPTAGAKTIENYMRAVPERRYLPFVQVDNHVLQVNEHLHFPFKIKEGERSALGFFAGVGGAKNLEVWPLHTRSVILGRTIFADDEGRIYRDSDLKGIGSLSARTTWKDLVGVSQHDVGRPRGGNDRNLQGLFDYQSAIDDFRISEELLSWGIRTYRVAATIGLNELIVGPYNQQRKISIQDARREGIIKQDFIPVVQVRAWGTRARVADVTGGRDYTQNPVEVPKDVVQLLLIDAISLVSFETSSDMSNEEYMEWFSTTLGKNIALLHNRGLSHGFMSTHNVSLDCRIVDVHTIRGEDQEELDKDFKGGRRVITDLAYLTIGDSTFGLPRNWNKKIQNRFQEISVGAYEKAYEDTRK